MKSAIEFSSYSFGILAVVAGSNVELSQQGRLGLAVKIGAFLSLVETPGYERMAGET